MNPSEETVHQMAERLVPGYVDRFSFVQVEDSIDFFEVSSEGKRVVVKGNNANSMAVGLNHYLKNYCGVTVSWYADDPVEYPSIMPAVEEPVRVEACVKERFFLNTFFKTT